MLWKAFRLSTCSTPGVSPTLSWTARLVLPWPWIVSVKAIVVVTTPSERALAAAVNATVTGTLAPGSNWPPTLDRLTHGEALPKAALHPIVVPPVLVSV